MKLDFLIDDTLSGLRLDKALIAHPQISSRSRAQQLIELGAVTLDGEAAKAAQIVKLGQVYNIDMPVASPLELQPLAMPLHILHDDDDIIVVNKPAGIVMHPSVGHQQDTLVNALLAYTDKLSMGFGDRRPGIVHRLDRDTSGVVVIARHDRAHQNLAAQFKSREIHRVYWALVIGTAMPREGRMESYLGRHTKDRKRFASVPEGQGKWAATNYRTLQSSPLGISLLELKLETGRTHQIRVHLSEKGLSVLGDTLYTSRLQRKADATASELIRSAHRFALHACELGFQHPVTGEALHFKVDWPSDLQPLIDHLGFSKN